ncbi:MAG TPA: hypothetical protein VIU61_12970 [Kofleriaceae bacterium]
MKCLVVVACAALASGCHLVFELDETPCPTSDGDAHDEDLDRCGDTVDNCPGIANPDQRDGDADTVGDVCDPQPTVFGNAELLFVSFSGGSSGWDRWGFAWGFRSDALHADALAASPYPTITWDEPITPGFQVQGRVTLDQVDTARNYSFSILGNKRSNGDTAQCSLGHYVGLDDTMFASKSGSYRDDASLADLEFAAGAILTFRAAFRPQAIDCQVTDQHGVVAEAVHDSAPILDAGEFGFDLSYVVLHLDHVAVYSVVE